MAALVTLFAASCACEFASLTRVARSLAWLAKALADVAKLEVKLAACPTLTAKLAREALSGNEDAKPEAAALAELAVVLAVLAIALALFASAEADVAAV